MLDPLEPIPPAFRHQVALLAVDIIEQAASVGNEHWGLTPYSTGLRVNVGWTEILTALSDHTRLIIDGALARAAVLPQGVSLTDGDDSRGFYPSIPGSLLAEIPYESPAHYGHAIEALRSALTEAVRVAARRQAGKGVKSGHRQEAVLTLASVVGRQLPVPGYMREEESSLDAGSALMEGALRRVVDSVCERNPIARRACIEHHGTSCSVCRFSFETAFGPLGRDFIHVHHLIPLSSKGGEYRIDPVADLRPVCPNCHAMLHRRDPPLSIEELQQHLSRSGDA